MTNEETLTVDPAVETEFKGPLLPGDFSEEMRRRWDTIQTAFVDDPRQAVQRADELVDEAMKRLADTFSEARQNLERQWSEGGNASTEDLRQALRRYRAFFHRLLSI
jgi:inorganic triphosphatase YgiF